MIVVPCDFEGPDHEYPDDWQFGGADGSHPAAEPRWISTAYDYYNDRAQIIWTTSVPTCDDEAIDYFTFVADLGPRFNPIWLSATRMDAEGNRKIEMLPWLYNKITDTATERPTT